MEMQVSLDSFITAITPIYKKMCLLVEEIDELNIDSKFKQEIKITISEGFNYFVSANLAFDYIKRINNKNDKEIHEISNSISNVVEQVRRILLENFLNENQGAVVIMQRGKEEKIVCKDCSCKEEQNGK